MTTCNTYFVTIDSSDRDRSVWPSSAQFQVQFDPDPTYIGAGVQQSFRNVVSIELVDAVHPYVSGHSHHYLKIRELDGKLLSTHNGTKYFAKVIPRSIADGFVYSYNETPDANGVVFAVRGTRIDKLTLELYRPNGDLADFGTDTVASQPVNPTVQTTFTFKINVENVQRY